MLIYSRLFRAIQARASRQESGTEMEIGEATQRSSSSSSLEQEKLNTSQTDESKVAEQQTSSRIHQPNTAKRVPCVADTGE